MPKGLRLAAALAATYLFWGTAWAVIKVSYKYVPMFAMLSARWTVAGLILLAIAFVIDGRNLQAVRRSEILHALPIGACIVGFAAATFVYAEQFMSSSVTAVLAASVPMWTLIASAILLRKPVSVQAVLGIIFSLAGLILLLHPWASHIPLIPLAVALAGSLVWAIAAVAAGRLQMPKSLVFSTAIQMLAAGALMWIVAVIYHQAGAAFSMHGTAWLCVLWLAIAAGIVPFLAYSWLLQNTSATVASTFACVTPVIALITGALALHEGIRAAELFYSALVVIGVALIIVHHGKAGDAHHVPPHHGATAK